MWPNGRGGSKWIKIGMVLALIDQNPFKTRKPRFSVCPWTSQLCWIARALFSRSTFHKPFLFLLSTPSLHSEQSSKLRPWVASAAKSCPVISSACDIHLVRSHQTALLLCIKEPKRLEKRAEMGLGHIATLVIQKYQRIQLSSFVTEVQNTNITMEKAPGSLQATQVFQATS